MALVKTIEIDKIEIVTEYKHIQVREATIIKENGVEISRTFNRKVFTSDMDVSKESKEIQDISNAVWTDEVKELFKTMPNPDSNK